MNLDGKNFGDWKAARSRLVIEVFDIESRIRLGYLLVLNNESEARDCFERPNLCCRSAKAQLAYKRR